MPSKNSRFISYPSDKRGIALVVTIILLSFLVLIMVALSSLVRVESKIAVNQDTLAQARQNALTGLNIALSKLQETAGPDQRVTARADIFDNDNSEINLSRHYQMNMTGVWDTSGAGNPKLITWLVNGNEDIEDQPPNIKPDSSPNAGPQSKSNKRILVLDASDDDVPNTEIGDNKSDAPLFDDVFPRAEVFDPSDLTPASQAPDFLFGDGHVYLVANGSVDVSSQRLNGRLNEESYKHASNERVILRKTPIRVDGAKLNGKAAGEDVTIGHYAYWVGDAGIKASLSSTNIWQEVGYDDSADSGVDYDGGSLATDPEYLNRKFLNQLQMQGLRYDILFRPGIELSESGPSKIPSDIFNGLRVPSFMDNPPLTDLNQLNRDRRSFYYLVSHPDNRSRLQALTTTSGFHNFFSDVNFSAPSISNAMELTPPPLLAETDQIEDFRKIIDARLRQLYHDVTPVNYSVLTNMEDGGLRRDLSAIAVAGQPSGINTLPTNLRPGVQAFMDVWRPNVGLSQERQGAGPKDKWLRRELVTKPSMSLLTAAANSSYPIVPIITEFEVEATLSSVGGQVKVDTNIKVELWNPYNSALRLNHNLLLNWVLAHAATSGEIQNVEVGGSTPGMRNTSQFSAKNTFNNGWPRVLVDPVVSPALALWKPGEIKQVSITASFDAKDNGNAAIVGFTTAPSDPSATLELRFTNVDQPTLDVGLGYQFTPGAYSQISGYNGIAFPAVANPGSDLAIYYSFQAKNYDTENIGGNLWPTYDPRGPILGSSEIRNHAGANNQGNAIQRAVGSYFDSTGTHFKTGQQVVFFDVPRQEILSVASLRHVVESSGAPIYRIGTHHQPPAATTNPNLARGGLAATDNSNSIFETHFVSSVPVTNTTAWDPKSGSRIASTVMIAFDPSPNKLSSKANMLRDGAPPAGTSLTGLQTSNSAQYLLVRDTLNINSTSVAAWRAFLAGALPTLADPELAGDHAAPYSSNTGSLKFDYSWLSNTAGIPYDPTKSTEDGDMRANWRYFDGSTIVTQPIRNAFFRFPHSATDLESPKNYSDLRNDLSVLTGAGKIARERAAFRVGLRELKRAQIEELAWWVVYYIKNRPTGIAAPFKSLKEFIDEGILQLALDTVGNPNYRPAGVTVADFPVYWPSRNSVPDNAINPKDVTTGEDFYPPKSPYYLMQGDLLEMIGHRLFARSDTFVIRVYGDVNDPDGNGVGVPRITSRVWLEATVQRVPLKHATADDPDDNMTNTKSTLGNFGRQFRILSLRWLRPEDV